MTALQDQIQSAFFRRPGVLKLHTPTKIKTDLFSNDFLSLSSNTHLRSMVLERLENETGSFLGSTGSRILDGNTTEHVSFEAKLRDYYNAEAALLFNSGYDANIAMFGTLPQEGDVVVYDKLIHASVLDGLRSSRAAKSSYPFDHNSATSLRSVLEMLITSHPLIRSCSCTVFVAIETLYSMDGDVAPIRELVEVVENALPKGCAQIIVDEAHSTGVYGPGGRGTVCHMGLEKRVDIRLHTFSKALASSGAVVICSPLIRTYLINFARPFIYSTAMSRICLIASNASLDLVKSSIGDQLRERLFILINYTHNLFKKELAGISPDIIRIPTSTNGQLLSAVIPIVSPYVVPLCIKLRTQGWATIPIIYPGVPRGEERIRFTVHAGNTEEEIQEFVRAIIDFVNEGDWSINLHPGFVFDDPDKMKPIARL